jgi:hypothetical protein
MCMTWGAIKAGVEKAGVKDDQEVVGVFISKGDESVEVCIEDGQVFIEGDSPDDMEDEEDV